MFDIDQLPLPWKIVLEESWLAFIEGTVPIGACILDEHGAVVSRNHNHIVVPPGNEIQAPITNHILAHAEMNCILSITDKQFNYNKAVLYSAVEPCPLCMGAIYMSGIRTFFYAAPDAYAGSANLLNTTWYLSLKPVKAHAAQDALLRDLIGALNYYTFLHEDSVIGQRPRREQVKRLWREGIPLACAFAEDLFTQSSHLITDLAHLSAKEGLEYLYHKYQSFTE
ncbi:MAG: nucleoside deaminase [Anaerolineaceae bacterium]|nr:nucleoside deaminase [Anaerolineaceae bacterium]